MFLELLEMYRYPILFIGMLFGGETFFVPAIFLSFTNVLSLPAVIGIALLATVISDSVWYYIGMKIPVDTMQTKKWYQKNREAFEKGGKLFDHHGPVVIVASKFVYGTRIAAQVLAGMRRMGYWRYLFVNILAILLLQAVIVLMAYVVKGSVEQVADIWRATELAFLVFVIILVLLHLWVKKYVDKRWFRQ